MCLRILLNIASIVIKSIVKKSTDKNSLTNAGMMENAGEMLLNVQIQEYVPLATPSALIIHVLEDLINSIHAISFKTVLKPYQMDLLLTT